MGQVGARAPGITDGDLADVEDEPLVVDAIPRALLLREVVAGCLREPDREPAAVFDRVRARLEAVGGWPLGPFGRAARTAGVELVTQWLRRLPRVDGARCVRDGLGRGDGVETTVHPPLVLELPPAPGGPDGPRTVAIVGTSDPRLVPGGTVVVRSSPGKSDGPSRARYHLRAAVDHLCLAAAGPLADVPHQHHLLSGDGTITTIEHAPWSMADARAHLTELCRSLLDDTHGYVWPLDVATKAAFGEVAEVKLIERALGFGPIQRTDGLAPPAADDALAWAATRLRPVLERLRGALWYSVDGEARPRSRR
ncbi:MAG: hypothetical protein R2939_06585 [Kofleriaceae bacterium]